MPHIEKVDIPVEDVRSLLDYDLHTGIFRWRSNPARKRNWNARRAGKVAGSLDRGYIKIRIEGYGLYMAHRLAWVHANGKWPAKHIDHINGNPSDNRLCNLREATRSQNMRNMNPNRKNRTGFLGVRFREHHGKFEARVFRDGKLVWHAYFDTAQEAASARRAKVGELDGEFASHDR